MGVGRLRDGHAVMQSIGGKEAKVRANGMRWEGEREAKGAVEGEFGGRNWRSSYRGGQNSKAAGPTKL